MDKRILLASAGLGLGAGWATRPSPPPPDTAEAAAEAAVDCDERRTVLVQQRESVQDELATARLRLRFMEARRLQREGPEQPWVPDADPRLVPETFERAAREAAERADMDVLELDCAEFPCIVAVQRHVQPDHTGNSSADYAAFVEDLAEQGYTELRRSTSAVGADDDRFGVVTYAPFESAEGFDVRLAHRTKALIARRYAELYP